MKFLKKLKSSPLGRKIKHTCDKYNLMYWGILVEVIFITYMIHLSHLPLIMMLSGVACIVILAIIKRWIPKLREIIKPYKLNLRTPSHLVLILYELIAIITAIAAVLSITLPVSGILLFFYDLFTAYF